MKYEAIEENRNGFSVRKMCEVLGVKESSFYRWKESKRKRDERRALEMPIIQAIIKIFRDNHEVYGYRKVWKYAKEKGIEISEYKVRKIMKENGLYPQIRTKFKPYPKERMQGNIHPNRIRQNFQTGKPNEVWVGDITYIKSKIGWIYVAAVLDLYNREIVGYAVSREINTDLVKRALGNAIKGRGNLKGLVFHSDRGSQYQSNVYKKMLEDHGIEGSMSRPGCPYDNSCMESFFALLKKEYIYRRSYTSLEEVKADVFRYIELFYNRKRMHSYLNYMSPVEYRMKHQNENAV